MNNSKLTPGQMIVGVGGVILIISLFLNWDDLAGQSAFDVFSGVDIILLLIGIAALAYAALTASGSASGIPPNSAVIISALGILALGIALSVALEDDTAGIGAWLALIAALAIAYGAHEANRVARPRASSPDRTRASSSPPPAV